MCYTTVLYLKKIGGIKGIKKSIEVVIFNNVRLKAVITTESNEIPDTGFFNIPLIKKLINKKRLTMINKYPHYDLKKDQDYFARIHKLTEFFLQKKDISDIKELLDGKIPPVIGCRVGKNALYRRIYNDI